LPKQPKNPPLPTGQQFAYWLAKAATQVREGAHATPEHVGAAARLRSETVTRFEKAENWPRDLDRLMAAYADVAGIDDARKIFDLALDKWYANGDAPVLHADGDGSGPKGAQQFAKELGARRRRPRAPGDLSQKPSAVPKRQAGS
jgi:hypothetical protein